MSGAALPQVMEMFSIGHDGREQSVDNYTEKDIIVGLKRINPLL